jgi:predicted protein tyrosine phosphatase
MEKKHVRRLQERFKDNLSHKKIICLNIPDEYQFMDGELIDILTSRLSGYIDVSKDNIREDKSYKPQRKEETF